MEDKQVKRSEYQRFFRELTIYLSRHVDSLRRVDLNSFESESTRKLHIEDRKFVESCLDLFQDKDFQDYMTVFAQMESRNESLREQALESLRKSTELKEKVEAMEETLFYFHNAFEHLKKFVPPALPKKAVSYE